MYITDLYEAHCTYVDDKYFDNHDYDDDTDADTDIMILEMILMMI